MKKKTLIERKKALKEAYYNELKKRGVLNSARKNLLAEAKELGLTGYGKLKNDELKKVIEDKKAEIKVIEEEKQSLLNELNQLQELTEENYSMSNEELKLLIEEIKMTKEFKPFTEDEESDKAEEQKKLPADGTIEDIDIPDITEAQVQAVANAIVEQSEEDNKPIDQVVNEIVEEGKEGVE